MHALPAYEAKKLATHAIGLMWAARCDHGSSVLRTKSSFVFRGLFCGAAAQVFASVKIAVPVALHSSNIWIEVCSGTPSGRILKLENCCSRAKTEEGTYIDRQSLIERRLCGGILLEACQGLRKISHIMQSRGSRTWNMPKRPICKQEAVLAPPVLSICKNY